MKLTLHLTPAATSWLQELRDLVGRRRVLARLAAIEEEGHLGDWKALGDGLIELRIHAGPGYRLYCVRRGADLIVILLGGDKDHQSRDIRRAKALAEQLD